VLGEGGETYRPVDHEVHSGHQQGDLSRLHQSLEERSVPMNIVIAIVFALIAGFCFGVSWERRKHAQPYSFVCLQENCGFKMKSDNAEILKRLAVSHAHMHKAGRDR
jgi:uncharacterized membrane protein YbjE (DUF340 family)